MDHKLDLYATDEQRKQNYTKFNIDDQCDNVRSGDGSGWIWANEEGQQAFMEYFYKHCYHQAECKINPED